MMTDKKLVVGTVALMPGRVRHTVQAIYSAQELVAKKIPGGYFENAPFRLINLIIRYGDRTDLTPHLSERTDQSLRVTIQLAMNELKRLNPEDLSATLQQAIVDTLVAIAHEYGLPTDGLDERDVGVSEEALVPKAVYAAGQPIALFTIQYPIHGFGTEEDLDRRHRIEGLLAEALRGAGLGCCTGGSTGSGTMEVHCEAHSPHPAAEHISKTLADEGFLAGATITCSSGDTTFEIGSV